MIYRRSLYSPGTVPSRFIGSDPYFPCSRPFFHLPTPFPSCSYEELLPWNCGSVFPPLSRLFTSLFHVILTILHMSVLPLMPSLCPSWGPSLQPLSVFPKLLSFFFFFPAFFLRLMRSNSLPLKHFIFLKVAVSFPYYFGRWPRLFSYVFRALPGASPPYQVRFAFPSLSVTTIFSPFPSFVFLVLM